MDKHLLEILVCPVTGAALEPANTDALTRLNEKIGQQSVKFVDGSPVENALAEALITRDGRTAYVVDDGIPVMLPERGIALD